MNRVNMSLLFAMAVALPLLFLTPATSHAHGGVSCCRPCGGYYTYRTPGWYGYYRPYVSSYRYYRPYYWSYRLAPRYYYGYGGGVHVGPVHVYW